MHALVLTPIRLSLISLTNTNDHAPLPPSLHHPRLKPRRPSRYLSSIDASFPHSAVSCHLQARRSSWRYEGPARPPLPGKHICRAGSNRPGGDVGWLSDGLSDVT